MLRNRDNMRAGLPHANNKHYSVSLPKAPRQRAVLVNQRVRGVQRNAKLPFVPPEDWYEPTEDADSYKIIVQEPGDGYQHVLTPDDIRERLDLLPDSFISDLEVVQFSRMTRKKRSFPCYGMQWGTTLYLYPIDTNLTEYYHRPPTPAQMNEARMYGGQWQLESQGTWKLVWTEAAIRDFYLNNILIHELGHLLDSRNTSYADRERYAEWFALHYGYKSSERLAVTKGPVRRRHHKSSRVKILAERDGFAWRTFPAPLLFCAMTAVLAGMPLLCANPGF